MWFYRLGIFVKIKHNNRQIPFQNPKIEVASMPEVESSMPSPVALEVLATSIALNGDPGNNIVSNDAAEIPEEKPMAPTPDKVPDAKPVTDPVLPVSVPLASVADALTLEPSTPPPAPSLALPTPANNHAIQPSDTSEGSPTSSKFTTPSSRKKRRSVLVKIRHIFDREKDDESEKSAEHMLRPRSSLNSTRESMGSLRRRSRIPDH
jgi:hypothetical protein